MLFIEKKIKHRVVMAMRTGGGLVNLNKIVRQASWKLTEAEGSKVRKRAEGTGSVWEWTRHAGGSWWQHCT